MESQIENKPEQEMTRSSEQLETEEKKSDGGEKNGVEKFVFYTQTEVLMSVNTKKDLQGQLKRWSYSF